MNSKGQNSVALIGCGGWGKNIARNLSGLGALAAIADPSEFARGLAGEYGTRYASDAQSVLADDDIAAVVWVGAARANDGLARALREIGFPRERMHVVGDAFAPRRLANALTEAHRVARNIGSPRIGR